MSFVIADVLVRHDPVGCRVPVLFDSPHSGLVYPPDFDFICPLTALRHAEDAYVDELFGAAPEYGATLLAALFPRSYIDANRSPEDIDPSMLDGTWPEPLAPTEKSSLGMGLIRTLCKPGMPIYDGRLPVEQAMERIDRYYRPYHAQVAGTLETLAGIFGEVWHLNCHSMPSIQFIREQGGLSSADIPEAADFVLGDRDGSTCESSFTHFMADTLRSLGYTVAINQPYKGVELVRRYANPAGGRHSLQLEINRRLYMNEDTLEKHGGFDRVQGHLTTVIRDIAVYASGRLLRRAAE